MNDLKKKTVSKQPITAKDRIQAAIRSSQYRKDWSAYSKNLTDYVSQLPEHLGLREEDLVPDDLADDPVAKKWNLSYPASPLISSRKRLEHNPSGDQQRSCHLLKDQGPRYLDIRVYLEAPIQDIQKGVMDLVKTYRKLCDINNRNPPPTKGVEKWKVYDMKVRENKSLIKIAREWWPDEKLGNPTYDSNAKNRHEQVSKAFKQAAQLVRRVEEEAAKNKTRLTPHRNLYKKFS